MTKWRPAVPWTTPRAARALSAAAALAVAGTGFVTRAAAQDAAATGAGVAPGAAPGATAPSADAVAAVNRVADQYLALLDSLSRPSTEGTGWYDGAAPSRARFERREDELLAALRAVDPARLGASGAWLTHAVLLEELEASRGTRVCRTPLWAVDQLGGWHIGVAAAAGNAKLGTPELRARALQRWAAIGPYVAWHVDDLRAGLAAGYAAPAPIVRRVIEQLDVLLPADADASSLMLPASRDSADGFPARWRATVREHAYPALRAYRNFLATEYLPRARASLGLGALPDGAACYRALVRAQTSLDLDPAEMRRIGAEERARTEARLAPIVAGLAPAVPPEGRRAAVRFDPAARFGTKEELLAAARTHLARAHDALPRVLVRVPPVALDVVPTPAYRERSDAPARYEAPRDSTSAGRFYVNTYEPQNRPRAEAGFMSFHEGWPGHHLQQVYPQRSDTLHKLLRRLGTGSFTEGWAFYAERLADELGLYPTPVEKAGYLLHQIDGWTGLEIDPAIHVDGMSREAAIDTIMAATGKPRAIAESYADRHAATPGQLVTYMLGYREIARLRTEAEAALGARFDLRRFHDVVLRDGSVPLAVLRRKIERWVAAGGT